MNTLNFPLKVVYTFKRRPTAEKGRGASKLHSHAERRNENRK